MESNLSVMAWQQPFQGASDQKRSHIWSTRWRFISFLPGWWFGTMEFYEFPYIGNVIIPTDFHIFFRGVGQPPTRSNQLPGFLNARQTIDQFDQSRTPCKNSVTRCNQAQKYQFFWPFFFYGFIQNQNRPIAPAGRHGDRGSARRRHPMGKLLKKWPSRNSEFFPMNSMVDLSIVFCKRLPGRVRGVDPPKLPEYKGFYGHRYESRLPSIESVQQSNTS